MTTGTSKLKAICDNKDNALFPNQFVNVRLLVDTLQNQVIVPEVAVQQGSSGSFVYVVGDDAKVKVENVQVGVVEGNDAQIISGVNPGDAVVTDGTDKLQNGSKVRIRDVNGAGGRAPGTRGAKKKAPAPKAASPAAGTPEGAPKTPKTLSTTPPAPLTSRMLIRTEKVQEEDPESMNPSRISILRPSRRL